VNPRASYWSVAIVATLTMTVSYIDRQTLAVLGPSVKPALGLNSTQFGILASAFAIAYLVATPLAGWWIDHFGARRGMVRSVFAWTAVAALHAIVPGFGVLFALRIALGVTEGPSFPGAAQTIERVLAPVDRPRGFGILFTGSSLGGMIVPPLASALFGIGGWRFAFLGTALAGLLWVPAWLYVTRHPEVRARLDAPELASRKKASLKEILGNRDMVRALISIFACAPLFVLPMTWGSLYLENAFGITQKNVGKYLWLAPLMMDVAVIVFGDFASRFRRRAPGKPPRLLFACGIALSLAMALLPIATTVWPAVLMIGVAISGGGILYALTTADLLARMPPQSVSFAGGVLAASQSLAQIIANPLIGASFDHYGNYEVAAVTLSLWVVPGGIAWMLIRPRPEDTGAAAAA
jgi:ACS family hexuronate transporter-like MFS transporter